jgi:hypothetical protein
MGAVTIDFDGVQERRMVAVTACGSCEYTEPFEVQVERGRPARVLFNAPDDRACPNCGEPTGIRLSVMDLPRPPL